MFAACYDSFVPRLPSVRTPNAQQVGVLACIMLLLLSMTACSKVSVAQEIVNWTPAIETGVQTVLGAAAVVLPADAPIFAMVTAGLDAAGDLLTAAAKSYLANPNANTLTALQNALSAMIGKVDAGLLQAARIVNPATQKLVLDALNVVAVAVNAILGLIERISSAAAISKMAHSQKVKLAQVSMLIDHDAMRGAAARINGDMGTHMQVTPEQFFAQQAAYGF